jgi:hypothetical protein
MVVAVVLANVAFLGLGSVFDYPDILQEDADEILASFRDDEGAIIALFVILALSAALLAPIAILLRPPRRQRARTLVDLGWDRRCGSSGDRPAPLVADRALPRRSPISFGRFGWLPSQF